MAYTVTFWGTRGSIPTPGAHTARYGGNTPCVAVEGTGRTGGGQLVILDAGTGIRALGRELVERQQSAVQAEILLSHAHWDHIRSEEHTSELQSRLHLVCRLLLEKKKQITIIQPN